MFEAIKITDLSKKYDNTHIFALNDLNLTVPQGVIFGLIGPNGAGKSTLINILAGTVIKTSGQIEIMGIDESTFPKKAREVIGIVPQEVVIDTFFPLEQILEFKAGYYNIPPSERKTEKILKDLGLYEKRKNTSIQLSGGMKRRFLIASSLVHSPKVLILDEPTAGVDLELRNQLWEYIKLLKEQGTTIIITTHYLAEAQELCDHIAFINKGKIIKQDLKSNLLNSLGSRSLIVDFAHEIDSEKFADFKHEYKILSANSLQISLSNDSNFNEILFKLASLEFIIKNITLKEPSIEELFYKIVHDK